MRIHITGCNGFIAGHLQAHLSNLAGLGLTDSDFAMDPENALHEMNIDVVIHAGALVGRAFGEVDPYETIVMNAASTALWARECERLGMHMLYLSTSEAYGDKFGLPADEDGPLNLPYNLYGLSKRWGEEACQLYMDPSRLTIARLSMPYGPGHPPGAGRAALTNFLWAAMQGERLVVHEGAKRCWCWVGDTVEALVLLAMGQHPGIYNVGRDDNETSMVDVAHMALRLVAEEQKWTYDEDWLLDQIELVPGPADQVLVKRLPTDRIRALGWAPQVELRQGMAATLAWLRQTHAAPVLP